MLLAVHHMLDQWRADVLAYLHTVGTSGMEMAALRRMHRVWHVALQNDATVLSCLDPQWELQTAAPPYRDAWCSQKSAPLKPAPRCAPNT